MNDPWQLAEKLSEGGLSSEFVKLKDGEFIECVFRGPPYTFFQAFKDMNEYSEPGEGRSTRFRINVIVKEASAYVPKIFQGGKRTLKDLITCRNEYGLDCIYKIKRSGTGKEDTKYHIMYKANLTDEQKEVFKQMPLLELKSGRSRVETTKAIDAMDQEPTPF